MLINFICNPIFTYKQAGWNPTDDFLAGTEESIVEWSAELVKHGHMVKVFYNGIPTVHKGVDYLGYGDYEPGDVDINVKHRAFDCLSPKVFYLTNETDAAKHNLDPFTAVILPSQWAKDNIKVNNKVEILPHGHDPKKVYPADKIPKTVLYASSPDRGLSTLLKVWPEVVHAHPDAQLIVTYGASGNVPNTMFLGEVDSETMNDLFRTSDIWCHPCNGGELFGMTGIKAQAAGCYPVYFPTMALSETVKLGKKSTPETLAKDLIDVLKKHPKVPKLSLPTWQSTTDRLLEIIG